MAKNNYSAWIGVWKAIKANIWTVIPFVLVVLSAYQTSLHQLLQYYLTC